MNCFYKFLFTRAVLIALFIAFFAPLNLSQVALGNETSNQQAICSGCVACSDTACLNVADKQSTNVEEDFSPLATRPHNLKEVNEPGTMVLVSVCLVCMITYFWRKRRRSPENVKKIINIAS